MSKVSGLLHEALAPEAQSAIFVPWIKSGFAPLFPYLTDLNEAHVLMLEGQGLLCPNDAKALLSAIVDMDGADPDKIPLDGSLEDVYFNYEAELIRRVGAELGGRLHIARSRNDLQSTLDRMRARALAASLARSAIELRSTLLLRSVQFFDCIMPGYTHMQHAQPITFGWYLLGVEQSLRRDCNRIMAASAHLNFSPLGAGALAGTTFDIDRDFTSRLLGFSAPMSHALDAVTAKDPILELLSAGLFLSTTISRLTQDFYNFSTFEFGMLDLPDNLAITSSIMPQKKNQAVLEFVKGRQAHLLGATVASFAAFHAKPYSHVLDASADGVGAVWDALGGLVSLVPIVRLVVETVQPQRARMADLAARNFCTATDLADFLVRRAGISFKEAHHVTGRMIRLALDQGLLPSDVHPDLLAEAARQTLGRPIVVEATELRESLDPMAATQRRRNCGGPSAHDSALIVEDARRDLAHARTRLQAFEDEQASARQQLKNAVRGRLQRV